MEWKKEYKDRREENKGTNGVNEREKERRWGIKLQNGSFLFDFK